MKRAVFLVIGLACLMPSRDAQAEKNVYLLGGVNIANMGGDAELFGEALAATLENQVGGSWSSAKNTRTGVDVGLGYSYMKKAPWGVAAEVHYAQRGVNWKLSETSGSGAHFDTGLNLAYIEFPVLLQFRPESGSGTRPEFMVGPVLGFRASSKFDASGGGASSSQDVSSDMKSSVFSGLVGAGVRIRMAEKSALLLQARYLYGFTSVLKDATFDTKHRDLSFHLGYSKRL